MAVSSKSRTSVEQVEEWRKHIAGWKRSGLTQDVYCKENGISKSTLGYWKRRIEREGANNSEVQAVVPVPCHLVPQARESVRVLRLRIGERYQVDIQDDFNPALLEKLLRTLSRLP